MWTKLIFLKQVIFLLLIILFPVVLFSQITNDSNKVKHVDVQSQLPKGSTLVKLPTIPSQLVNDSISLKLDVKPRQAIVYQQMMELLLKDNIFLISNAAPVATANQERKPSQTDFKFYILLGSILFLSFLRFFYARYFNNLFRVFFNTSLRQSQLTDQLLQAKLASMLFNLFFAITGGIYVYFLLSYHGWISQENSLLAMSMSIGILALIYFIKFLTLKFTGWLTGYKEVADTYLFIIFLINKILSVLLIPFIIVLAFSLPIIKSIAATISLLMIALLFLLRFLRSFGLLKHQIKVGWFHFLLFIIGIEILPILLIYKGLVVLLNKNL